MPNKNIQEAFLMSATKSTAGRRQHLGKYCFFGSYKTVENFKLQNFNFKNYDFRIIYQNYNSERHICKIDRFAVLTFEFLTFLLLTCVIGHMTFDI